MRRALTFCVLVGLGIGCFGKTDELELGGETNWFGWCESDSDCAAGSCVCGICTTECSAEETSCAGAPPGSECVLSTEGTIPGQCGEQESGACLRACDESGACGFGLACSSGWCVALAIGSTSSGPLLSGYFCESNPILTLSGDLTVKTPDELEALRGCREIRGSLTVDTHEIPSLEPLSELRSVSALTIGPIDPGFYSEPPALRPLSGLENLQRADEGLNLSYFSDPDLGVLENLTAVDGLSLTELPNLSDLSALEGAGIRSYLNLRDLPELRDIAGPELSASLASLNLSGLRKLETLTPVRGGERIDYVEITDTGLTNLDDLASLVSVQNLLVSSNRAVTELDGLSALRRATSVSINSNPALTSIDGLSALETLTILEVSENTSLPAMPEFSGLTNVVQITISGNSSMISGPSFPLIDSTTILIDDNERLETLLGFAQVQRLSELNYVIGNPRLREIDLRGLQRAGQLAIGNNPSLVRLDLSALEQVTDLGVYDNPSLAPSGTSLPSQTATRFGIPIESAP